VGVVVPRRKLNAKRLRSGVRAVLTDEKYRRAARETQAAILQLDGSIGAGDVRYWTSVLGIEHPRPSLFDEGLDNTLLPALQSGTKIARC